MLSKLIHKNNISIKNAMSTIPRAFFSARSGPYNPYKFKEYLVPKGVPRYPKSWFDKKN